MSLYGRNVYSWKVSGLHKVDAQKAGEELEKLTDADKNLSPEKVVEASRSEDAVLHGEFEWNDETAAEKYRVEQARSLIRNLTVKVIEPESKTPVETRAFVHIAQDYRPIHTVIKSQTEMEILLATALRDAETFRSKYATLTFLKPVLNDMEQAENKIKEEIKRSEHRTTGKQTEAVASI